MERPPSLEEFLRLEKEIFQKNSRRKGHVVKDHCRSCRDPYPLVLRELTEGHCSSCARELFYDDVSPAIRGVLRMNRQHAQEHFESHKAHPEGQRYGMGHTGGG